MIDSDGFLYITGRIKEIIVTAGGENVPPVPIEDDIKQELPCVSNALVVGKDYKKFTLLDSFATKIKLLYFLSKYEQPAILYFSLFR